MSFGLDGRDYEIDLTDANASEMREALFRYVQAARKVGGFRGRAAVRHTTTDSIDAAAVRAWAASKDIQVSPRGRIKAEVVEQYRAAGN